MTEKQINYSLLTNKLQLSFWDKATHYGIVIYLIAGPIFVLGKHFFEFISNKARPFSIAEIYMLIILTSLAGLFYKLQKDRLDFKEIFTQTSRPELEKIIQKVSIELNWDFIIKKKNLIIAKTNPPFLSGSWGEQVTIIFDTKRVLINSICDPEKKSSIVSMGRNKKNIRRLLQEIACH